MIEAAITCETPDRLQGVTTQQAAARTGKLINVIFTAAKKNMG
jgi:hypothetical protein